MKQENMIKYKKGFVTAELLIFLAVISLMAPIVIQMLKTAQKTTANKITKARIEAISKSFEKVFMENLKYVNKNCYGWTDAQCSNLTATPIVKNTTTLTYNTQDASSINALLDVGCSVSGSTPNFDVKCYDGQGKLMKFAGANLHVANTEYVAPNNGKTPQITITSTLLKPMVVNIDTQINNALVNSEQKIDTIANAIKTYVRQKRIAELGNTCGTTNTANNPSGGLDSIDDAVIPFAWEAISSNPTTLCSGIENTSSDCGCSSFNNNSNWEKSSAYCVVNSQAEMNRFLVNMGLGSIYRTDGLGNPITIVPLSDNTGSTANCPPPRPKIGYGSLSSLPKSRVGVMDSSGTWVKYTDVYSE